jgi:hypothetical protein
VEKENNCYTILPLKNKNFLNYKNNTQVNNTLIQNTLINYNGTNNIYKNLNLLDNKNNFNNLLNTLEHKTYYDYNQILKKQLKKTIEDNSVKNKFITQPIGKFFFKPQTNFSLDNLFDVNKTTHTIFKKNIKTLMNEMAATDNKQNLWGFLSKNNVVRNYPNITRVSLSGNLLLNTVETSDNPKTNNIATTNLT